MTVTIYNLSDEQIREMAVVEGYADPKLTENLPSPTELAEAFRECAKFIVERISTQARALKEYLQETTADTTDAQNALAVVETRATFLAAQGDELLIADSASLEDAQMDVDEAVEKITDGEKLTGAEQQWVKTAYKDLDRLFDDLFTLQMDHRDLTKLDPLGNTTDDQSAFYAYGKNLAALSHFVTGTPMAKGQRRQDIPPRALPMYLSASRIEKLGIGDKVAALKQSFDPQ